MINAQTSKTRSAKKSVQSNSQNLQVIRPYADDPQKEEEMDARRNWKTYTGTERQTKRSGLLYQESHCICV